MKLSIITVCKNAELTIEKTISSVLNQTFTDYEYIIVDGASTDKTMEVVERYSAQISKIISEPDNGIYQAMNKGISLSEGEYLMFLNSGDYLVNSKLLNKLFDLNLKEDIVYGDTIVKLRNRLLIRKNSPRNVTKRYMFYDTIPHPAAIIKKKLFIQYGNYDVNFLLAADFEFFLRALFKYKCTKSHLNFPLCVFNLDGISSDSKNKKKNHNERNEALKLHLTKSEFNTLSFFKPLFLIFFKYLRYAYYILMSRFYKKYLGLNNE